MLHAHMLVAACTYRRKIVTAKSARLVHDRSLSSDGVQVQECASRRRKFVRVVQGWRTCARLAFL